MNRSCCCLFVLAITAVPAVRADDAFDVDPPKLQLDGPSARAQLLVRAPASDLTHTAQYRSSNPKVASVSPTGQVQALADGDAEITITAGGVSRSVPVHVAGANSRILFDEHVLPIMSKAGCNLAACHASQYGQGEFKLSVFGSDPAADHLALVRSALGRRVSVTEPGQSVVLLKPTGGISHGGAVRLNKNSTDYRMFHDWIGQGATAPAPAAKSVHAVKLRVIPDRRTGTGDFTQQLRVVADFSDGSQRDVTHWARFDSMDDSVLQVSPEGLVNVTGRGQSAAMAKFQGQSAIMQVVVPFGPAADLAGWKENNFIDTLAAAKFRELGLTPAPLADDAAFIRRAYLQAIGQPPSVKEVRSFLESKDPEKRTKLVDRLLGLTGDPKQDIHNNAYAAWWGLKWADLLRNRGETDRKQEMWALHNWLQAAFRENKRFDAFVRDLITARGSTVSHGPANFYRIFNTADDRAEGISQIFLGVRMQCAKCHHHPFETISQADYYGVSAFFTRVGTKNLQDFGVRFNNQEIIVLNKGDARHPRTGAVMAPTPLHAEASIDTPGDRRKGIADWITAADNPYFARNIANRYWAHFMGRGLVDPVDDLRATNPPTNPELLDALAKEFVRSGYDVKQLIRTIMTSRLYQLDSTATRHADAEGRFFASFLAQRIPAESLSDAIDAAAEVTSKFAGVPTGTKAIELPDAFYNDRLLTTFGKPKRESVCECERTAEPSLAQALHVLNSETIHAKLTDAKGRVARLVAAKTPLDAAIEELYLATVSRLPTVPEMEACRRLRAQSPDDPTFYQDLLWSLCNSKHFLFVR